MKKYKLLRFGKCYINKSNNLIVQLLRGSNKRGYTFSTYHAGWGNWFGNIQLLSRIVPNDGNWIKVEL